MKCLFACYDVSEMAKSMKWHHAVTARDKAGYLLLTYSMNRSSFWSTLEDFAVVYCGGVSVQLADYDPMNSTRTAVQSLIGSDCATHTRLTRVSRHLGNQVHTLTAGNVSGRTCLGQFL